MTQHHDNLLGVAIMLMCGAAAATAFDWQVLAGFVVGVILTFVAAAVVNSDDDFFGG